MIVAVLPFQNVSGRDDLDYFAVGFVEDIITDLSKFNHLQLISRYSIKPLTQTQLRLEEISSKLDADYLVCGSFRSTGDHLRIGVQLIEAENNRIIWAERYDRVAKEVFQLQDEIINGIVGSVHRTIDKNVLLTTRTKNTTFEAYDLWLKGYNLLKKGSPEDDLKARTFFEQSLEKDAAYARAYTGISLSYFNEWSCQLWDKWQETQDGAFENALKAVSLDEYDAVSLAVLGRIYLYKGEFERAEHCCRKSLRINSNDADTLTMIAASLTYLGLPAEAEKLYLKTLKLNPLNHDRYNGIGLFIYFELGRYSKALELSSKISFSDSWVDISVFIAGSHFLLGEIEQARELWKRFEENFAIKIAKGRPFSTKDAAQWIYYANPFKGSTRLSALIDFITAKTVVPANHISSPYLAATQDNYFKRIGELREICFEGKAVSLPEVKGFTDLAILLNKPNTEIHCAELMGTPVATNDSYFVLDEKAKIAYRDKLKVLQADISEAEEYNDTQQALKLKAEYEKLIDHLSKALGKGGNIRKLNSPVEKMRSAITWRIRSAIKKVEPYHPSLALHLSNSIKTGLFCCYSPEKRIFWNTD